MDFSRVELSADDQAFQVELRDFLATIVTDDVIRHDRETGENFHEGVHRALGDHGYLAADFNAGTADGFTKVRKRIWELEIGRAHTLVPLGHNGDGGPHGDAVRHPGTA